MCSRDSALRLLGSFMVTVAKSPERSTWTLPNSVITGLLGRCPLVRFPGSHATIS